MTTDESMYDEGYRDAIVIVEQIMDKIIRQYPDLAINDDDICKLLGEYEEGFEAGMARGFFDWRQEWRKTDQ